MRCTYSVLDELAAIGFGYVPPLRIVIEKADCPCWTNNGTITIPFECREPRCIAHEMGHGWHLWQRLQLGYRDEFGEDAAEAIRWFVEERLGDRTWQPRDDWTRILEVSEYSFDRFKEMLKSGELFRALPWKKVGQ